MSSTFVPSAGPSSSPLNPGNPHQVLLQSWIRALQTGQSRPQAPLTKETVLGYVNWAIGISSPGTTPVDKLRNTLATVRNMCTVAGILRTLGESESATNICMQINTSPIAWLKQAVDANVGVVDPDIHEFVLALPEIARTLEIVGTLCGAHVIDELHSVLGLISQGLYILSADKSRSEVIAEGSIAPVEPAQSNEASDFSDSDSWDDHESNVEVSSTSGAREPSTRDPGQESVNIEVAPESDEHDNGPALTEVSQESGDGTISMDLTSIVHPGVPPAQPTLQKGRRAAPSPTVVPRPAASRARDPEEGSTNMNMNKSVDAPHATPSTGNLQSENSGHVSRSGVVSMDLTTPVGVVPRTPHSHEDDPALTEVSQETGDRTVSMDLASVVQPGNLPGAQPILQKGSRTPPSPAVVPRRAASEHGSDASAGTSVPQLRTPSEGGGSFNPDRSARAMSTPPLNRQPRAHGRSPARLPKAGDAGAGERRVSGQSTKSSNSNSIGALDFERFERRILMKEFEGQLALSNLRLEVAQAQLVKANEEGEHQRLLIAKLEDRLEQEQKEIREERKELREERKELREDLKAHRQGFADQISKMEQRLEQERKEHRDERARMQDEYEARIAKLEERLAKAVV